MNRETVYHLLMSRGELSKADISRQTGISAPTVIKIIDYFKDIGCVEELGEGEAVLGRKPQMLRFNPSAGYSIGVEYSGIAINAGIVDLAGNLCFQSSCAAPNDFAQVVGNDIPRKIEEMISDSGIPRDKLHGVCLGVPGVVDTKKKTIDLAPLVGVRDSISCSEIFDKLSARLGMPVIIENDANAAAIGEMTASGMGPHDDLMYIMVGKGLGAGIILDGKLRKGKNYSVGEMGYMVFAKDYKLDKKNAGWLENRLQIDRLRSEDIISENELNDFALHLSLAIVNVCVPLEINKVVIGRLKSLQFDTLLVKKIREYLNDMSIMKIKCSLPVCSQPTIVGCASLVTDKIFSKKILTE
jgi:predicted NBD/HSP70 family sugar kinase